MLQTKTIHLWKVSYAIIVLGWWYLYCIYILRLSFLFQTRPFSTPKTLTSINHLQVSPTDSSQATSSSSQPLHSPTGNTLQVPARISFGPERQSPATGRIRHSSVSEILLFWWHKSRTKGYVIWVPVYIIHYYFICWKIGFP